MDYMILIYRDESEAPEPGSPEHQQMLAGWLEFNQRLIEGGHWVAGGALQLSDTATTVRLNGDRTVTDGPYAETKEQLGGYYVITAPDLDVALELAGSMPAPDAAIEVRPLSFRPDAS
jgi:hypothetical protein